MVGLVYVSVVISRMRMMLIERSLSMRDICVESWMFWMVNRVVSLLSRMVRLMF